MSRISINDKDVAREVGLALVRVGAHATADPTALTSSATGVAITYTTDDPAITADAAQTIADGDTITAAETLVTLEELNQWFIALRGDVASLRTAVVALNDDGNASASSLSAVSQLFSTSAGLVITYTTDDPSITVNNAVTIADGDAVTEEENHEIFVELNAELVLNQADFQALAQDVNAIIAGDISQISAAAALGSTANPITFTYTTDNPSITPNAAITVADGDAITNAEAHEGAVELDDQVTKLRADLAAIRVTVVALLKLSGAFGT